MGKQCLKSQCHMWRTLFKAPQPASHPNHRAKLCAAADAFHASYDALTEFESLSALGAELLPGWWGRDCSLGTLAAALMPSPWALAAALMPSPCMQAAAPPS